MTISEVKKIIEEFFCNFEYRDGFINQKYTEELQSIYSTILPDINALEKDGTLDDSVALETSNKIKNLNNIFQNSLYEIPITKALVSFIKCWSMLVYNWNQNTLKDKFINTQCEVMPRIVDGHLTVIEAINNLKIVSNYFGRVRSWLPPAIDISKHYFNILQKKDE